MTKIKNEGIEINESMISNHREFNNCGSFDISVCDHTYFVKYDTHTKSIETDAPAEIKDAICKWWFL